MGVTYFPFTPSSLTPFTFQPTLDGNVYSASVPSLLFGNRYYLNLTALDGTEIWFGGIVGSPTGIAIQSLSWANGFVSVVTAAAHGYRIASTVALNISGCTPSAYNGLVDAFITGPASFSFPLATNPGMATVFGSASYDVNLIGGVQNINGGFFASRLVFRQQSQQFEVSP